MTLTVTVTVARGERLEGVCEPAESRQEPSPVSIRVTLVQPVDIVRAEGRFHLLR